MGQNFNPVEVKCLNTNKMEKFFTRNTISLLFCFIILGNTLFAIDKPNIIIFYVDDLGWQDVQVNDLDDSCPFETPNIVKLAEAGMNFPQAYASANCCSPSRAAIITGQHPAKNGMTSVTLANVESSTTKEYSNNYLDAHLNVDLLTLPDVLKQNGYYTGHTGKWHIGLTSASYGFDFVNETRGVHRSMDDRTTGFATEDDESYPLSVEKYPPYSDKFPDGISYPYDELTEASIQFIDDNKDQPFFLNMCHWMVHWPVLTRNGDLLEYYCDKMGQSFPPASGDMTLPGQQNPYFAAMVSTVDWSLGRVIAYLDSTDDPRHSGKKLIETTYIFFSSDNGGAEQRGDEIISDNAPLKYGKTYCEQGGVRVTTIISGPQISEGSEFDGMVSQLDFFPTILDLTNTELDSDNKKELSGLDISPVLFQESDKVLDEQGEERTRLFWHFPHSEDRMKSSIREGDFTLYKNYPSGQFELYRLYEDGERLDLEEQNNLAENPEYTSVLARLAADLDSSLTANSAQGPYLNPLYENRAETPVSVKETTFSSVDREARLTLENAVVKKAYVLYVGESDATSANPEVQYGVKLPADITDDSTSVSATIPHEVTSYRFILIDEYNYQVFTDIEIVEEGDLALEKELALEDFTYSLDDSAKTLTIEEYIGSDLSGVTLTVPSSYTIDDEVYTVVAIGTDQTATATFRKSEIQRIVFPNTLEVIKQRTFQMCTSLDTISFPASLKRIEKAAFGGCTALAEISFETGSQLELIEDAFSKAAFTSFVLPSERSGFYVTWSRDGEELTNLEVTPDFFRSVFTAVWTNRVLLFDANGGEGTMNSLGLVGDSVQLPMNTFNREGYVFSGWATSADGGVLYEDGAFYTPLTENETLFAVWTLVNALEDSQNDSQLFISPNPTGRYFTLNMQSISTRIYNLSGQCVKCFSSKTSLFDVSSLENGTYLVEVEGTKGRVFVDKLIKY